MENKPILLPEQYNLIWKISFIHFLCSIYAMYRQHYIIALCPACVFVTSLNYWRYPDYSWRRYVDMVVVKSTIAYQIVTAYNAEYNRYYYITLVMSLCFYPTGIYYHKKRMLWHSTIAHVLLHLTGAVTNIILYSGDIPHRI